MQEQKGGRTKSESKQFAFRMTKNTEDMLKEIQEFTGVETTAEAIRLCIFTFYNEKIESKYIKNKP